MIVLNNLSMEIMQKKCTEDFKGILDSMWDRMIEYLQSHANLTRTKAEQIASDEKLIRTYINEYCFGIFTIGWMLGFEEGHQNRHYIIKEYGKDYRKILQELLTFLQINFSDEKVIDVFHDLGMLVFESAVPTGKEY